MTEFAFPILSAILLLPFIGALFIAFFISGEEEAVALSAKRTALWVSLITFIASLWMIAEFDFTDAHMQMVESYSRFPFYQLGVDGISFFFILLTTLLTPICILASWQTIKARVKEYMIAFLLLEVMVIGVFCANDFILFYIFFEVVLIPMFLIIGIWGGENRIYASFKFFLYTLAGSLLLLLALVYCYLQTGTTDLIALPEHTRLFSPEVQKWLWLALFASFAVKVPMWPFHTWLPDAHVQAPTAGSVILAGILLKLGGYGFLRLSLPFFPLASEFFAPMVMWLSVIAIIYTSAVALMQTDMKKLIAYSSVAHMGYVTISIFSFNLQGLQASIFVMISHGLVSAALFLCVGVLYDRLHTKEIRKYGGVTTVMPRFALLFLFFTMASIGLPGTSGFVGELLAMVGAYQAAPLIAILSATGVILGAAYMLWLYRRVMYGEIINADIEGFKDISLREKTLFLPLAILVLLLGVAPFLVTDVVEPTLTKLLIENYR